MTKLIWMSDLHFTAHGLVQDHDPRQRLTRAVDFINAHHADSDYCVISGDLVNHGTRSDYDALRKHLDRLRVPYLPMVGNHDDRQLVREILSIPKSAAPGFVQYAVDTGEAVLICLDTLEPGEDSGAFCAERRAWLTETLERMRGRPAFLFLHHPPMPLGLPMQDQDRLENGAALLEVLGAFPDVCYLFIGHVHRPICGAMQGLPFATMRSVLYQAPPPVPDWDWGSFEPGQEAPALGIVSIADRAVTLHYTQFCTYEEGVSSAGR